MGRLLFRRVLLSIICGGFAALFFFILKIGLEYEPYKKPNQSEPKKFVISQSNKNSYSVLFFASYDCPISKNYIHFIHALKDSAAIWKNFSVFVFREDLGEDSYKDSIKEFVDTFTNADIADPDMLTAKALGATVTPEVFILDSLSNILYHGAIDNWAYETGKHRQVATSHYLLDAIQQIRDGEPISISYISPIGCYIEYKENKTD